MPESDEGIQPKLARPGELTSYVPKTTLPERYFGAFPPIFWLFLQNEPNSHFFPTHSWRNSSAFFSWVRLVKTPLFWKDSCQLFLSPRFVVAAVSGRPPSTCSERSEPESVERRPRRTLCRQPSIHTLASIPLLMLPILPYSQKTRYRTLEGLEGLEAFLSESQPLSVVNVPPPEKPFSQIS
jgi:hypothetical protein